MTPDGQARVDLLVAWIKKHKKQVLNDDGEISPTKLAKECGLRRNHWSDILDKRKPSFAARSARAIEERLGIRRLYLEGPHAVESDHIEGWPFGPDLEEMYGKLSEKEKGEAEGAFRDRVVDILERRRALGNGGHR